MHPVPSHSKDSCDHLDAIYSISDRITEVPLRECFERFIIPVGEVEHLGVTHDQGAVREIKLHDPSFQAQQRNEQNLKHWQAKLAHGAS